MCINLNPVIVNQSNQISLIVHQESAVLVFWDLETQKKKKKPKKTSILQYLSHFCSKRKFTTLSGKLKWLKTLANLNEKIYYVTLNPDSINTKQIIIISRCTFFF